MIIEFIDDYLTGDAWERLCDFCYRDRFQFQNYVKVDSAYQGDVGIEGFTQTGMVYQCYCPEKNYSDNELYDHLRIKLTTDIGKLISIDNKDRFRNIGVPVINEWHFLIPENRDKRLLEHIENKRQEVLRCIGSNTTFYDYIDVNFKIVLKVAEDLREEIEKYILDPKTDIKLNAAIKNIKQFSWEDCESEKLDNIRKKIRAIIGINVESENDYIELVNIHANAYLRGIELMSSFRTSFSTIFEELSLLAQQYKIDVQVRSKMNNDSSLNGKIFQDVLNGFGEEIGRSFPKMSTSTVMELRRDLVASWLADCSLRFR